MLRKVFDTFGNVGEDLLCSEHTICVESSIPGDRMSSY